MWVRLLPTALMLYGGYALWRALSGALSDVRYSIDPGRPYGSRWGPRRPPGLPASARKASRHGAAISYIRSMASRFGLGEPFVRAVVQLAEGESRGGTFALPADNFNALPPAQRRGASLITAWGVFQHNRDAWRALSTPQPWDLDGRPAAPDQETVDRMPWEVDARGELWFPLRNYAGIYRHIRQRGGSPLDAARGLRYWHVTPAGFRRYLRAGPRVGWPAAWRQVSAGIASRINRHLSRAGVAAYWS